MNQGPSTVQTQFAIALSFQNKNNAFGFGPSSALAALLEDNRMASISERFNPRGVACVWMAVAMALHFGGYEFARASNLAMFTSPKTGFGSAAAFPLAMALVTPLSLSLLWGYNNQLEEHGPRLALRHTTLFSILAIGGFAMLFQLFDRIGVQKFPYGKWVVGLAFIFQNSYAHLLYTQQWSFLGSVMLPTEGASWFSAISGLSSISSTLTGSLVSVLVPRVGLYGLLAGTVFTLTMSMLCGDRAYATAEKNGFDPSLEIQKKATEKRAKKQESSQNLSVKASELFGRVPSLKALFYEVISFQSLSTILNVCFVGQLKQTITNDVERAAWTGKFYASINALSGLFQFILLPLFMKRIEPKLVWKLLPIVPAGACIFSALQASPSLGSLATAFFSVKFMDYSLRGVVSEMVYVPLDFESRYVGKEVIGVFANRFGKSVVSVALSAITYFYESFSNPAILTKVSTATVAMWIVNTWKLSRLVPKQQDAEETVEERRKNIEANDKRNKKKKK